MGGPFEQSDSKSVRNLAEHQRCHKHVGHIEPRWPLQVPSRYSTFVAQKQSLIELVGTFNSGDDDRYFGSSGRGLEIPPYNVTSILDSYTNLALQTLNPRSITKETIAQLRAEADVSWCRTSDIDINCAKGCLFDMHEDPCETTNIIELKDGVTKKLRERIEELSVGVVSQPRLAFDPKSDPVNYNNTWCTWLDDELCTKTENIERIRR